MKNTMRAISVLTMLMMVITCTSITAFAANASLSARINELGEKYYLDGLPTDGYIANGNGGKSIMPDKQMDSLEKAFSYLGTNFMKNLLSYSSESKLKVTINENDISYGGFIKGSEQEKAMDRSTITRETEDTVFFEIPAEPSVSVYAQKSYSPYSMSINITSTKTVSTQDILTEMGDAFLCSIHRDKDGNTISSNPQWFSDKYCTGENSSILEERAVAAAYMWGYKEIYATVFARGIMNGGDNPCSKDDQYIYNQHEANGGRKLPYNEHYIATGIYNDLVKYIGYDCTATQRMADYIDVDISQYIRK